MPVSGEAAALVFLAENDHPEINRRQLLVPFGSMRKVKSSGYRLFLRCISLKTRLVGRQEDSYS
jgi:mRNA-degrading endonuclease RelE of RelBE toxin-antitoxin system